MSTRKGKLITLTTTKPETDLPEVDAEEVFAGSAAFDHLERKG